jgi:peptidylprolyl isomerase
MDGHSTSCFEKFAEDNQLAQGKVTVWKVDWDCGQDNSIVSRSDSSGSSGSVVSGASVSAQYIGYLENGTVFDSSLPRWRQKNLTPDSGFTDEFRTIDFVAGSGGMIAGFDEGVRGMVANETRTFSIPPEKAYGKDPDAHELGNKTLFFKVRVISVE